MVGGGDSALDEALVLTEYVSQVIVFHRRNEFRGQKILQDRVLSHSRIEVRWNTTVEGIVGNDTVEAVSVADVLTGKSGCVDVSGVFIYVGLEPNVGFAGDLLTLDNGGHILVDLWMRTSVKGIFAAGDVRQHSASQLASAAGDGVTAAIAARRYIRGMQRRRC